MLAPAFPWSPTMAVGVLEDGECDPHPLILTGRNPHVAINTRSLPPDYIHNVCRATIRLLSSPDSRPDGATVINRLPQSAFHPSVRASTRELVSDVTIIARLLRDCVFRTLLAGAGVAPVQPISLSPAGGLVVASRAVAFEKPTPTPRSHELAFALQLRDLLSSCEKNGLVCLGPDTRVDWDDRKKSIVVQDMGGCFVVKDRTDWVKDTVAVVQRLLGASINPRVVAWTKSLKLNPERLDLQAVLSLHASS